jgi:hypothetical protein
MKKRFTPFSQSDSIRWEKYNRKRTTIVQSKNPYVRRMEEEMEVEKELEKEKEKKE